MVRRRGPPTTPRRPSRRWSSKRSSPRGRRTRTPRHDRGVPEIRGVSRAGAARSLAGDPPVHDGEAALPGRALVVGHLPGPFDGVAVRAEGAGVALPEAQLGEVGGRAGASQPPSANVMSYHAHDAARVEVVLRVGAAARVGADDRDAVGRLGDRDLDTLDQEGPVQRPLERRACRHLVGATGATPPGSTRRRRGSAARSSGVPPGEVMVSGYRRAARAELIGHVPS